MKQLLTALFLCTFLTPMAQAAKMRLPDACGEDKVQFGIKTEKNQPPPAGPEAGKAQIILIESVDAGYQSLGRGGITTRVGVDGAWVGANKGDSYFFLAVAPGEHHLCAVSQSFGRYAKPEIGLTSFTAEADKVYYYQIKIAETKEGEVLNLPVTSVDFELTPLNEDQGKYMVQTSKLSLARFK